MWMSAHLPGIFKFEEEDTLLLAVCTIGGSCFVCRASSQGLYACRYVLQAHCDGRESLGKRRRSGKLRGCDFATIVVYTVVAW